MFKRIAPIEVSDELAVPGRRPWASALRARCVMPPLTVCVAPVGITPPADGGTPRRSPQRTWMWGTSAPVALVVDCAPRSYRNPSEFELTVSLLCSLGFRALADGAALAVIARGCAFTIGNEVDLVDLAARLDLDAFDREIFPELHRRTASLRPALTVLTGSRSALAPLARQLAAIPNRGELAIVRSEPDAVSTLATIGGMTVAIVSGVDPMNEFLDRAPQPDALVDLSESTTAAPIDLAARRRQRERRSG